MFYSKAIKKRHLNICFLFSLVFISFLSKLSAQPVINSFNPLFGPVGTQITISGNNFNPIAGNNIVYFGATKANVTSATATSVTVIVPPGATFQFIKLVTNGFTAYSSQAFNLTAGDILTPGSFAVRTRFAADTYPEMIARGDLDGDGAPDMVVSNFNSGNISILRNTSIPGTISFAPTVNYSTAVEPEGIKIDDMNSDGKEDIIVTSISSHLFSIFINTSSPGNISFAPRQDFNEGNLYWPRGISTGDIDGDGKPDVAVADNNKIIDFNNNTSYGTLSIHRNNSAGGNISFAPFVSFKTGEYPRCVFIGDLDNDKMPDLAVTNQISQNISVFRNNSTVGNIDLVLQQTLNLNGNAEQIVMGDLDGDGKADMVATNLAGVSSVSVFRNTSVNGSISFASRQDIFGITPLGLSIGDIDGDNKPDIVVTNFSFGKVSVLKNTSIPGTISFSSKIDYDAGNTPIDARIGDVDLDGFPDISVSNGSDNEV